MNDNAGSTPNGDVSREDFLVGEFNESIRALISPRQAAKIIKSANETN